MNANKHLTRAKDRATGEWVVGYYIGESGGDAYIIEPSAVKYDVGSIDTSPVHECDPKTVGGIAPRQDTDGKNVFEGDYIEYTDEVYSFTIHAFVNYGEFRADGSVIDYDGVRVCGWHVSEVMATPPEWDDDDEAAAEYPAHLKIKSLLEIPDFKVINNRWDMSVNTPVGGMSQNTAEELIERLGKVQRTVQKTAENALRYINNY